MNESIRLSLSLTGAAAMALTSLPGVSARPNATSEAQGKADDLGLMSISLKDVIKPQIGFQGQTQAAGTPNEAGLGGYLPIVVGQNSVFFLDVLANVNFSDINHSSSIINTEVSGTTISTSSRLGYRWLNGDRSWMFGVNGGYDTRPMSTGNADTGVPVTGQRSVFFQQAAFGLEAVHDEWSFNAYGLIPTGTTEYRLNSSYAGGALHTYGLDVGYSISPTFSASLGYYYQHGDLNSANGSGILARLAYNIDNDLTLAANLSFDDAFKSRFSADIRWRFNAGGGKELREKQKIAWQKPTIKALTESVKHRDVRVADCGTTIFMLPCSWLVPATVLPPQTIW